VWSVTEGKDSKDVANAIKKDGKYVRKAIKRVGNARSKK